MPHSADKCHPSCYGGTGCSCIATLFRGNRFGYIWWSWKEVCYRICHFSRSGSRLYRIRKGSGLFDGARSIRLGVGRCGLFGLRWRCHPLRRYTTPWRLCCRAWRPRECRFLNLASRLGSSQLPCWHNKPCWCCLISKTNFQGSTLFSC